MNKKLLGVIVAAGFMMISIPKADALTTKTVTPEMYGANGFDKIDDTAALEKAFAASVNVRLKEGATYYTRKQITINHSISITAGAKKASIVKREPGTTKNVIKFENKAKVTTTATSTLYKGQTSLKVKSTAGMKVGDILEIKSNKLWAEDNRGYLSKGEMQVIKKISGNTIYTGRSLADSYKGEKITVKAFKPNRFEMKYIIVKNEKVEKAVAIDVDPSKYSHFYRVEVYNAKIAGIIVREGINTTVDKAYVSLGTTPDIPSGYGYQDYGGIGTEVAYSTFKNVRRGVDFSGDIPSRYGIAKGNKAYGPKKFTLASGNSGFGTHSTAEYITFESNYIENFDYAFNSRGSHLTYRNNTHYGDSRAFVGAGYGTEIYLQSNRSTPPKGKLMDYFILKTSTFKGVIHTSKNSYHAKWFWNRK